MTTAGGEVVAPKGRRLPSLLVILLVLAVVTVAGVFLGVRAGLGAYSLLTLLVTGALALVFVNEYRKLPVAQPNSNAGASEDDPFEDPVEEADRLDRELQPETEPSSESPGSPGAAAASTPTKLED